MFHLISQKVIECIFNELRITKNNDVDETAVMNFFDDNVKEANWKPILKSTFKECLKEITNKNENQSKSIGRN